MRWNSFKEGDYDPSTLRLSELVDLMGSALEQKTKKRFIDLIIENALKFSQPTCQVDNLDAPIHTLKLARVFVTACSGCWKELGFTIPLNEELLQKLAVEYGV